MKIKSLCHVLRMLEAMLDFYVDFGPELPTLEPDVAFNRILEAAIEVNKSQTVWKAQPGSEQMELCFLQ